MGFGRCGDRVANTPLDWPAGVPREGQPLPRDVPCRMQTDSPGTSVVFATSLPRGVELGGSRLLTRNTHTHTHTHTCACARVCVRLCRLLLEMVLARSRRGLARLS